MDLTRGGGPGSGGPTLSLEQQQQLEMQRDLERQQLQTQQLPQVLQTLDKQLADNPQTQALLKGFKPEEQDSIKKALAQGVTERVGPNGLSRIDLLTTTNDGGLYIRFNRSHSVTLRADQLPKREQDGQSASRSGLPSEQKRNQSIPAEPALSQTEREAPQREAQPRTERTEPATRLQPPQADRAPSIQHEQASVEPTQHPLPIGQSEPARYTGPLNLTQRQQQESQNTPLSANQVAEPKFEHGVLVVPSIPYQNPFGPQPISHEPHQRQTDIQQQLEPKLGKALEGYTPTEQNQLKQALTTEISDVSGNRLQIDHVEKLDDGRLAASLNRGLQQIHLDPQQVLQPEQQREALPTQEPLSATEQQRQESQQHIQQQVEKLTQHQPFERLAIENRLREAVGDERIESMRIDGEDTISLGLRNGMVMTASTHELLNMDSGRELLQRAQTDPAAQSNQGTESGLTDPSGQPDLQLQHSPIAFTVRNGEGPAHIGQRLDPKHADAAAWYVVQNLKENYGHNQHGVHYSPQDNRLIIKEGQQGSIDLAGKSEAELAEAAYKFRRYMGKESHEDQRRDIEAAKLAERQRQQAEREQQERDNSPLGFAIQYLSKQNLAHQQPSQASAQNHISYQQKPINYYATNLNALGLDPASEDAYIKRRTQEGGWTGVTALNLTARKTFYEGWNLLTLGAVRSQDELVLQRNQNLITNDEYNRGTLWNAGSKTAMVIAGGWMVRAGGMQTMELRTLAQSVRNPWAYVGAGASGTADAVGQYKRSGDVRLGEVAAATVTGFLLTPYAMRANVAGNGIIGAASGMGNASFQNAYYGDHNDLAKATTLSSAFSLGGAWTGGRLQNFISPHSSEISALAQPKFNKTPGYVLGNITSMLINTPVNLMDMDSD